jgi:hypothetical protein
VLVNEGKLDDWDLGNFIYFMSKQINTAYSIIYKTGYCQADFKTGYSQADYTKLTITKLTIQSWL